MHINTHYYLILGSLIKTAWNFLFANQGTKKELCDVALFDIQLLWLKFK